MSRSEPSPRYGVLVPVKPPAVAKSRLSPLGEMAREELAAAFAMDSVTAALGCPTVARVLAVTDDFRLAVALREIGAEVVPDGVSDDLNGTLVQAAAELVRRDADLRLAALCADLPALRSDELARALSVAPSDVMAFVADAEGSGTTLVAAPDLAAFDPRFGPDSAQAHRSAGAREIERADVPSLRRDVDTPDDLEVALALGVGPRTSLVSTALRRVDGH